MRFRATASCVHIVGISIAHICNTRIIYARALHTEFRKRSQEATKPPTAFTYRSTTLHFALDYTESIRIALADSMIPLFIGSAASGVRVDILLPRLAAGRPCSGCVVVSLSRTLGAGWGWGRAGCRSIFQVPTY